LIKNVGVVVVPGADDGMLSQLDHRVETFRELAVLHEPSWRLRTEPDTTEEDERWDEGGSELKTPCVVLGCVYHDEVGSKAAEDTY